MTYWASSKLIPWIIQETVPNLPVSGVSNSVKFSRISAIVGASRYLVRNTFHDIMNDLTFIDLQLVYVKMFSLILHCLFLILFPPSYFFEDPKNVLAHQMAALCPSLP
jgi:hypothetical protein